MPDRRLVQRVDGHPGILTEPRAGEYGVAAARFEATLQPAKAHRHSDAATESIPIRMFETGSRRAFSEGL
jgi:hypothetical protein